MIAGILIRDQPRYRTPSLRNDDLVSRGNLFEQPRQMGFGFVNVDCAQSRPQSYD